MAGVLVVVSFLTAFLGTVFSGGVQLWFGLVSLLTGVGAVIFIVNHYID